MEYTESGQPNNTSWSSPAERKRQLSKHKGTSTENGKQNTSSTVTPEKSAIQEATIWQRPETDVPPETHVEAPVSSVPATPVRETRPALPPKEIIEESSSDALRQAVHDAFAEPAASSLIEKPIPERLDVPLASDSTWVDAHPAVSNYDGNPDMPSMPRRPYFWTEPEVRQPRQTQTEHDVLPPVLPATGPRKPREETFETEMPAVDPAFAEAVNPNLHQPPAATAQTAETMSEEPSRRNDQSNLANDAVSFTRRTPDPGVESSSMQYPTLEHAPMPLSTTNEPMPEGSLEYPTPFSTAKEHASAAPPAAEKAPDAAQFQEHTQRIETELSRTIFIDGTSVYDMYIAKQIDAEGLHRIINEYMRGGDFRNIALQEVARQQIRFERDPQMRHTSAPATALPPEETAPPQPPAATATPIPSSLAREQAERLTELTQGASEKMQDLVNSPHLGTIGSIVAIIAIYTAIIIIVLAK